MTAAIPQSRATDMIGLSHRHTVPRRLRHQRHHDRIRRWFAFSHSPNGPPAGGAATFLDQLQQKSTTDIAGDIEQLPGFVLRGPGSRTSRCSQTGV